MSWRLRPQTVSRSAQKNFAIFMAELPERFAENWLPDEAFYRQVVSLAVLFRAAQSAMVTLRGVALRPPARYMTMKDLCPVARTRQPKPGSFPHHRSAYMSRKTVIFHKNKMLRVRFESHEARAMRRTRSMTEAA